MDWQILINIIGGSVLATIGWFAREIWDAVKELRRDIKRIEANLPEIYVRKDDFKSALDVIGLLLKHTKPIQTFRHSGKFTAKRCGMCQHKRGFRGMLFGLRNRNALV